MFHIFFYGSITIYFVNWDVVLALAHPLRDSVLILVGAPFWTFASSSQDVTIVRGDKLPSKINLDAKTNAQLDELLFEHMVVVCIRTVL